MSHNSSDMMWEGKPGGLAKARENARWLHREGNHLAAHSEMLSAYISIAEWKYFPLMLWHAFSLQRSWARLDHNQLDVLIAFWLGLLKHTPKEKSGLSVFALALRRNEKLLDMACREVDMAQRSLSAPPHQEALAYITFAQVRQALGYSRNYILPNLECALKFEKDIRAEKDQPQGFRQLFRIFRKAGEVYVAMGDLDIGRDYLWMAVDLGHGAAKLPQQAEALRLELLKTR